MIWSKAVLSAVIAAVVVQHCIYFAMAFSPSSTLTQVGYRAELTVTKLF